MKNLIFLLINSLGLMIELAVEKINIVKYAMMRNSMIDGMSGMIENFIVYKRFGVQVIRRRPIQFKIKNPNYWEGRMNRFRDCMKLCQKLNTGLKGLYQDAPKRMTYFNLLASQLMKFWVGGPAPAPYIFTPGKVEVEIGNGKMPDARKVEFKPKSGTRLQISWDTECIWPTERPGDTLQIMVIGKDGKNGIWLQYIRTEEEKFVMRSNGKYILKVHELFYNTPENMEVYCAIKFKTMEYATGKANGNFKFPVGIEPIVLMP